MLTLIANLGEMRTERWMDDDYVVCPVRMIVSGVLEGSEGPLYYPPDEIEASVNDWNGMPVVVYHPLHNGQNVSARQPAILEKYFLGWVFNCIYNKEFSALDGEAWMNRKRLEYIDMRLEAKYQILPRITSNIPVEVSTGLGTINHPTENGIDPKSGKRFTHIARNYKPDHLAILPDREGACNVDDGCGLRTNETLDKSSQTLVTEVNLIQLNERGNEMSKAKLVSFVANNCDCWKGDETTLNGFSEDKLKKLKAATIDGKLAKYLLANRGKTATQIVNTRTKNAEGDSEVMEGVKLEDLAELFGVSINPASDPVGYVDAIRVEMEKIMTKLGGGKPTPPTPSPNEDEDDEDDDNPLTMETDRDKKPTDNKEIDPEKSHETNKDKEKKVGNKRQQLTDEQFMKLAPPGIRRVLSNAMKHNENRKKELVEALTNNHSIDENNRNIIRPTYEKMSLEDLEVLASTIPAVNQPQNVMHMGAPLFIGNGGGPVNAISDKVEDLMPLPWDHE